MEAMVILLTSDVRIADLRRRRILSIVRSVGDGCKEGRCNMAKKQKTIRTCFGNAIAGVVGLEKTGICRYCSYEGRYLYVPENFIKIKF